MKRYLLLIVFLLSLPAWATTYYVDNCVAVGSDSDNGTSTSTPWLTIAHVNAQTFNAGDSVLFRNTCTWAEQLTPPSSGSAGNNITFSSYGTGAIPIITGSNTRGYVIHVTSKSYVTISNLQLENSTGSGFLSDGVGGYITVSGIVSTNNIGTGIAFEVCSNCAVTSSTVTSNGDSGIWFYDSPSILIDSNTVYGNNLLTNDQYSAGIKGDDDNRSSTNAIIRNNLVYSNGVGQTGSGYIGAGIWIDTIGTGAIIQYNQIYANNLAGIFISADDGETVAYNVINSNGVVGYQAGMGIELFANAKTTITNNQVYGNTLYGNYSGGIYLSGPNLPGGCTNNTVSNNLSAGSVGNNISMLVNGGCENPGTNGSGNVYTYNGFGPAASNFLYWGTSYYSTYATWEIATGNCGSAGCSHSLQSGPQFNNPSGGDFTLQSRSPAIDAGTNLGSTYEMGLSPSSVWPSSVTTLNQNNYGTGWEIGAFVFPATQTISGTISPSVSGAGATVTLSGAASATATADASGNYSFSGLVNGNYTVAPSKSGFTFSPTSQAVTINGANLTGVNFSTVTYTISGTINGAGGNGATVTLSGAASATVTANSSGAYTFTGLASGSYTVTPSLTGFTFSPTSQAVTVSNANVKGVSFSTVTYTISGTINGAGGNGATVTLSGAASATVTANSSGAYTFTGLTNGTYTVTPSLTGFTFSPASQAVTVSSANVTGVNFSTVTYTISGTISGTGGNGATVTLSGAASASVTANSSGAYTFTGLTNGSYTVTPSKSGFTFSPSSQAVTVNGANVTAVNFSTVTYTISGTISGTGGNGATVTLSGPASATVTANSSGAYTFTGLTNGTYTVTPSMTGFSFSPTSQTVTVNGANVTAVNFSTVTYTISGTISGTGGNGATVTLSGAASASVTANSSGAYTFTGMANGSYTVTPSMTGFTFTPASQAVTVSSANVTGVNFSTVTYTISGTISGTGGNGATVTLSGAASATVTANSSGAYTFTGVANGSYTVTPSKSGFTFSPTSQAVTVSSANVTGVNFSTVTYTISGTISGTGGNGATVTLSGAASATVTANSSGAYTFTGLASGSYTVTPSLTGFTFSPTSQAVTVSSANVTAVNFSTVTYTLSGNLSPAANGSGATLTLGGASSATTSAGSSGNYSFSGLTNGTYSVTPSKSGYTFSPAAQSATINGANVANVNFTVSVGSSVVVSISPTSASLSTGGTQQFTATVTGTSNTAVTWLATGGTVSSGGLYTAPGTAGNYTVTATSAANTTKSASATVAVNSGNVIFYDDFAGTTLSSAWTVISRHGEYSQGETECNVPQMVTVNNGLTITTEAQSATCGDYFTAPSSWPYITGDIQWATFNFTYGTVEIYAKFPPIATALWPATWLLGSNCQYTNPLTGNTGVTINGHTCPAFGASGYAEIDMTECYGGPGGWCGFSVYDPGSTSACNRISYSVDTNWHLFTTVWTSSSVKQYMDGNLVTTCNKVITKPMFLIIQTQTGGVAGTPHNSDLPAQLQIGYVQVTQP